MVRRFLGYTVNILIIAAALLAWFEYRRDHPIEKCKPTTPTSKA